MTPEQFAYWFQGFAELNSQPPTPEQWQSMREHVATVFKKVTPQVAQPAPMKPVPSELQKVFDEKIREHERKVEQAPLMPIWQRPHFVPQEPMPYWYRQPIITC